MPLERAVWTCLLLCMAVSSAVTGAERKKCAQYHCGQTSFMILNVTKEIVLSGCRRCAKCSNQTIVQSWWYYYYENGTRSPNQIGGATRTSNYSINVGDVFTHSGEHFIYTNYKYLCKNRSDRPNGFALSDIKIKLRVVDVGLQCLDEMPVSEGGLVNLQCSSGLSDTLDLTEEFYFDNQSWTCPSLTKYSMKGRRNAHRNPNHNYDCELEISEAQVSDSGYYQCRVYVPGHDPPLMSRELQLRVISSNSLSAGTIIAIGLGAILIVILFPLILLVVYNVYRSVRARRRDPERRPLLPAGQNDGQHRAPQPLPQPQPQPQPQQQPLPQPQPQPLPLPPDNQHQPPVPNGDQNPPLQPCNGDQQPPAHPHLQLPLPNGADPPQPLEVEAGSPHPQANGHDRSRSGTGSSGRMNSGSSKLEEVHLESREEIEGNI